MSISSGPPQQVEQHCYRHADRRAGVSCQRCNRPICPSCMITASVGFQCPECAQQGAKQQRLVDTFRQQNVPRLTYALIGINVAMFLLGIVWPDLGDRFALTARATVQGVPILPGVGDGEWWRIVTSGFLHAGLLHLGMNMYVLYLVGGAMERVIGRVRFGLIYAVSLVGGSLGALAMTPNGLTVGASGAIFGLFAALACLELSRGQNPMQGGIGPTILLNLVITLVFSGAFGNNVGGLGVTISAGGHIGGLIAGGISGALLFGVSPKLALTARQQSGARQLVVAGVGVALLLAAIATGYALA